MNTNKIWACACLLSLGGVVAALSSSEIHHRADAPKAQFGHQAMRIASTNLCTDLLLLSLVPVDKIAGVSELSRPAVEQLFPHLLDTIPFHVINAENILEMKPDLLITSPWSNPWIPRIAEQINARTITIEPANNFADIKSITRQLGKEVGAAKRAEELIKEMEASLTRTAALADTNTKRPRVIAWNSGDTVPAQGTLTDEIIQIAGGHNLANQESFGSQRSLTIEEVLTNQPAIILQEAPPKGDSARTRANNHPALSYHQGTKRISYNATLHACGLPQSADEALTLAQAIATLN